MQHFIKDGQVRRADDAAHAVALRYDGWVEVTAAAEPEPDADPKADAAAPAKTSRKHS